MICAFCGQEIATTRTAYREVVGWERNRAQGGTNALALRKPLDRWAHSSCIDKAKTVGHGQGELF